MQFNLLPYVIAMIIKARCLNSMSPLHVDSDLYVSSPTEDKAGNSPAKKDSQLTS